jgi:hypothetical protein
MYLSKTAKHISLAIIMVFISSALYFVLKKTEVIKQVDKSHFIPMNDHEYYSKIQPIFDSKCVACHSCYNSPCQLNLTNREGLGRGANKINVYDFPMFKANSPTRLTIDAHTSKEWKTKKFYSVINQDSKKSILNYVINKSNEDFLKSDLDYNAESSRTCMNSLDEIDLKSDFAKTKLKMPYGFPSLNKNEIKIINKYSSQEIDSFNPFDYENNIINSKYLIKNIKNWENFLNQKSLKSQISSRYFYEHLFLANIFFEDQPNVFFRLVRSKSKDGSVDEIATVYPFDNPKGKFFYRLRPVTQTLVHKSFIPFEFSDLKLKKWKKDFIDSKWVLNPTQMPKFGSEGSNPFVTFESIPVKARYQFFLDESAYHVMTFIKGPVCRGPTALNVINDHFWVLFMDPESDALVKSVELYNNVKDKMTFPAKEMNDFTPMVDFRAGYWNGVKLKFNFYAKQNTELNIDSLWSGDKTNSNSSLTVFRHFDSATVLRGLNGQTPKTVWVLDYQVFESIYYNLTAGYNVFGPILHQLNSRLFMDISRIASEDLFLSFLPKEQRLKTRTAWNKPTPNKKESIMKSLTDFISGDISKKISKEYPYLGSGIATKYTNKDFDKEKLLSLIKKDLLSAEQANVYVEQYQAKNNFIESKIKLIKKEVIKYLPDTILIKYLGSDSGVYTLINNNGHYNVSMILYEDARRDHSIDYLTVLPGIATSYVNLFMELNESTLESFVGDLNQSLSNQKVLEVLKKYGVSRKNLKFWDIYDDFSKHTYSAVSHEQGQLDLNRYENL